MGCRIVWSVMFCLALVLALHLALFNMDVHAAITGIEIEPENPTETDSIVLTVHGLLPDSCWYYNYGTYEINGNQISISLYIGSSGGFCTPVIGDYSDDFTLGQLTSGTYFIRIAEYFGYIRDDYETTIFVDYGDNDSDGIINNEDNCPDKPNGPNIGTCTAGATYKIGRSCVNNSDCGEGGFCSMNQEDTYPPGGDGIGDACYLCEGNFNCDSDSDVDGSDAALFKADFGRSAMVEPCTGGSPCNGDFNCDGDSDGSDASLFKSDFGRSAMQNPCPVCVSGGPWCSYP